MPATHGRRTFQLERSDSNPFDKPKPEVLITLEDEDETLLDDLKPVDEKFQRTLNVASLRQMIEEAELEEDPVEEEKKQIYVPQKLQNFRMRNQAKGAAGTKQASSKEVKNEYSPNKSSASQRFAFKNKAANANRAKVNDS